MTQTRIQSQARIHFIFLKSADTSRDSETDAEKEVVNNIVAAMIPDSDTDMVQEVVKKTEADLRVPTDEELQDLVRTLRSDKGSDSAWFSKAIRNRLLEQGWQVGIHAYIYVSRC